MAHRNHHNTIPAAEKRLELCSGFDGDGKTDPAKFVPSTGSIWYMQSSASDAWAGVYMGSDAYQVVN